LPLALFVSGAHAPQLVDPEPPIHGLSDAAFLRKLRRLSGIPDEVFNHAELMQMLLPALRADVELCETHKYVAEAPLSIPITVFGGKQDCRVRYDHLSAWRAQTSARFALRVFPGHHFFVDQSRSQMLAVLSEQMMMRLEGLSAICGLYPSASVRLS
jgi:medium-chain acyl-[acyl-carrier-protein] hydrolase